MENPLNKNPPNSNPANIIMFTSLSIDHPRPTKAIFCNAKNASFITLPLKTNQTKDTRAHCSTKKFQLFLVM